MSLSVKHRWRSEVELLRGRGWARKKWVSGINCRERELKKILERQNFTRKILQGFKFHYAENSKKIKYTPKNSRKPKICPNNFYKPKNPPLKILEPKFNPPQNVKSKNLPPPQIIESQNSHQKILRSQSSSPKTVERLKKSGQPKIHPENSAINSSPKLRKVKYSFRKNLDIPKTTLTKF